jgi:cold shock CspA family protein
MKPLRPTTKHRRERVGAWRVTRSTPRGSGKVVWITDGYGFIEDANGDQYYFDRNCMDDPRYEDIHFGMRVEFQVECAGGTRQARHVTAARVLPGARTGAAQPVDE